MYFIGLQIFVSLKKLLCERNILANIIIKFYRNGTISESQGTIQLSRDKLVQVLYIGAIFKHLRILKSNSEVSVDQISCTGYNSINNFWFYVSFLRHNCSEQALQHALYFTLAYSRTENLLASIKFSDILGIG